MNLFVNGVSHPFEGQGTVAELLEDLHAAPAMTAVMINGDVVRRSRWESVRLAEGDHVELIVAAAGG
jgi:sulfur carrier protein